MRSLTFYTSSIIATVAAVSISCLPTSAADSAGTDAGRAVVATHMPPLPGAGGNHGDNWRAMVQAEPGATFHDLPAHPTRSSYGTPLMAPQKPLPAGVACNWGDVLRQYLQNDDLAIFTSIGSRFPPQADGGVVAGVEPGNASLHGRGGWNAALVELQAHPGPLPWQTQVAEVKF
jgi:hypothetical protein